MHHLSIAFRFARKHKAVSTSRVSPKLFLFLRHNPSYFKPNSWIENRRMQKKVKITPSSRNKEEHDRNDHQSSSVGEIDSFNDEIRSKGGLLVSWKSVANSSSRSSSSKKNDAKTNGEQDSTQLPHRGNRIRRRKKKVKRKSFLRLQAALPTSHISTDSEFQEDIDSKRLLIDNLNFVQKDRTDEIFFPKKIENEDIDNDNSNSASVSIEDEPRNVNIESESVKSAFNCLDSQFKALKIGGSIVVVDEKNVQGRRRPSNPLNRFIGRFRSSKNL